jgi:hypothetical protein
MADPTLTLLLYFILPLWLAAGVADWLCHRAARIERTTGAKETLIHLLMLAEVGVALVAAIFLEVDAAIFALMIVAFLLHEATALWDVSYATTAREVTPLEQHVHSFLEMIPLMAMLSLAARHWPQLLSLFGAGGEAPDWSLARKQEALPTGYVAAMFGAIVLLEVLPYVEELLRGLHANGGALVPTAARRAAAEAADRRGGGAA